MVPNCERLTASDQRSTTNDDRSEVHGQRKLQETKKAAIRFSPMAAIKGVEENLEVLRGRYLEMQPRCQ